MSILTRSESRQGKTVRLLAVHSTEGNGTAQALRDAAWWTGSSHAINDETGTLLTPAEGCVPYDRAAWTIRSGNLISENIEQVGWARYSRAEWLARPKLLDGTARWLAARSKARGIPLVKLSPADVKAGKSGVIGHVDWTVGMNDGTHTDPGPNYPWDVVLDLARRYANPPAPAAQPQEDDVQLTDSIPNANPYAKDKVPTTNVGNVLQDIQANAAYAARQTAGLTAALTALTGLVSSQNGLTVEDVRAAVAAEIAKGVDVSVTVGPTA